MLISSSPYRISFLGGGTDYPGFLEDHDSVCISTAINKRSFVSVMPTNNLENYKHKLIYSETEFVEFNQDIKNNIIREVLGYCGYESGITLSHLSELPGRCGIGSSSAFMAACLSVIDKLNVTPEEVLLVDDKRLLARACWEIEHDYLQYPVGYQDVIPTVHGGFNIISFRRKFNHNLDHPTVLTLARNRFINELESRCLLLYTHLVRNSQDVSHVYTKPDKDYTVQEKMQSLALQGGWAVINDKLDAFIKLIHESWLLKREIDPAISTGEIDEAYSISREIGAEAFKLCGAGNGGVILIVANSTLHNKICQALPKYTKIPFRFESRGTTLHV